MPDAIARCGCAPAPRARSLAKPWRSRATAFAPSRPRLRILTTGSPVVIRRLRLEDEPALRVSFDALSERSRYQRFLSPVRGLSDEMWHRLCDVDGAEHIALAAFDPGERVMLGVTRCMRLPEEPSCGERAITIADSRQRKGLGTLLVGLLVEAALAQGYRAFDAHALAGNLGIRRLLAHHGTFAARGSDDHAVRLVLARGQIPQPARTAA